MSGGGRIDPATGRKMRDKVKNEPARGPRPERWNGKIVKGGKLAHQRTRRTQGGSGSRSFANGNGPVVTRRPIIPLDLTDSHWWLRV